MLGSPRAPCVVLSFILYYRSFIYHFEASVISGHHYPIRKQGLERQMMSHSTAIKLALGPGGTYDRMRHSR
jgi:hypothetical protein